MERRIVFATTNQNKMREIHMILQDLGIKILSMKEAGVEPDIVEDGSSFEENALIKARTIHDCLPDDIILADDSGLEIDALDKAPGIYSSRFAGTKTPYDTKMQLLLDQLEGVPTEERTARYVCAVAAVFPSGEEEVVRGTLEGVITDQKAGENGFGYDPIFYVPSYHCTTAQMEPDEKNAISHRGKALRAMRDILETKEEQL